MALADAGYRARMAGSATSAISAALDDRPDLILLDLVMPGVDGPSALTAMRGHDALREVPVIFMGAPREARDARRYTDLGALGVLSKPLDLRAIATEIRRLLGAR